MRKYQVKIQRTYTTYVILKYSDDGKNHEEIIEENLANGEEAVWDLIYEKELEQMNVDNQWWEIEEINNNTITGALSNDTGPRN